MTCRFAALLRCEKIVDPLSVGSDLTLHSREVRCGVWGGIGILGLRRCVLTTIVLIRGSGILLSLTECGL